MAEKLPPESREELVEHLEKLTGRTLRTREDIQAYVREVAARKPQDEPAVRRWLNIKRITLAVLLAFGVMQYYILDVLLEITSMQTTTFFVPARAPLVKSALAPAIVAAHGDVRDWRRPRVL